jgi:hypothetical protein
VGFFYREIEGYASMISAIFSARYSFLRTGNKAGTHTGDKIAWQGPLWKLEKRPELGDRKCLGNQRKSFIGHPDAI